jgi:hypothetical protein
MSDDDHYDDDSHSGGLWDPDAYAAPPARERPTLRVIESGNRDPRPPPQGLATTTDDALVRLDQFRPVDPQQPNVDGRPWYRRAAALGAAVLVIAAIAVTAFRFSADGGGHRPTTTASRLSIDPEQAALERKVAPQPTATKHQPHAHPATPHTKRPSNQQAGTPVATRARSAPSPPAQQPSQATTRGKPKKKVHEYDAVSSDTTTPELTQPVASSEFGFEP